MFATNRRQGRFTVVSRPRRERRWQINIRPRSNDTPDRERWHTAEIFNNVKIDIFNTFCNVTWSVRRVFIFFYNRAGGRGKRRVHRHGVHGFKYRGYGERTVCFLCLFGEFWLNALTAVVSTNSSRLNPRRRRWKTLTFIYIVHTHAQRTCIFIHRVPWIKIRIYIVQISFG